jgi:anti-sigma factor RsiW
MRGKISDQDLTKYALNDGLDARERLYVESMLGISEECRNDVYRILDLAQMLEEGFEAEAGAEEDLPSLTAEQRAALLEPQPERVSLLAFAWRSAATLALAACVALALVNPQVWNGGDHQRGRIASVSSEVSRMVSQAISSQEEDISNYVTPPTVYEDDSASLIQTSEPMPTPQAASPADTICTPPSWQSADVTEIH